MRLTKQWKDDNARLLFEGSNKNHENCLCAKQRN